VVVAARYRLHPAGPVTYAEIRVNATAPGMRREFARFLAPASATLDERWTGGLMKPSTGAWITYFEGSREEAERSAFLDDLRQWNASLGGDTKLRGGAGNGDSDVELTLYEFESYSQTDSVLQPPVWVWAPTMWMNGREAPSNWLVPRQWMHDHPEEAAALLDDDRIHSDSYFIGGVIGEVGGADTAVHPAVREAGWILVTEDEEFGQELREMFPESGADYNHGSATLEGANFGRAFWGSNYERLLRIKNEVDPQHRFACNNCVGWGTRRPAERRSKNSSSGSATRRSRRRSGGLPGRHRSSEGVATVT